MHETPDIEVQGDEFEDQQAILKQIADDEAALASEWEIRDREPDPRDEALAWARSLEDDDDEYWSKRDPVEILADDLAIAIENEREAEFECLVSEEQDRFEARFPVVPGITLNGQPVRKDVESGEIVDNNGEPINSCDALRIIDGVKDDPDDE
jgi:hypothetical protein